MGIAGLLPLLSEAQRKGHVKEFAGQTVGVDSYIWLYKGAFSCAVEVGLGTATTKYVTSFMNRARMLRHFGVEPLFVFDGGPLPSKRETERERQRSRTEKREQAIKLWNESKRKAAFELFQRSLEATPQMARDVIDSLQEEGFQYLVAPYEADAQLAFLESQGIITAAISEDSDLIAFGCKKVLFKMNQCGEGVVFDRARIHRAKAVDIGGWSDAQIRRMCILSGCDYAASAPGIGLRKAHRYVARSTDIQMAVRLMRADGVAVADGYEDDVERAELTFLYQRVYDPRTTMLDFVTPLAGGVRAESMPFIGDALDPRVAQSVAEAEIDPFTFEPFRKPSAELEEAEGVKAEAAAADDDVKEEGQRAAAGAATRPQPGPATPVRRTLVSLWRKKSAFATILAKPSAPDAQQASLTVSTEVALVSDPARPDEGPDDAVRVKFRARDTGGPTVSTAQCSRFFSKPASAERAESNAAAPADAADGGDAEEPSPPSTAVAPETPEPPAAEARSEPGSEAPEEHTQPLTAGSDESEQPTTAGVTDTQDTDTTLVWAPPEDAQPGASRAHALFAKFAFKSSSASGPPLTPNRRQGIGSRGLERDPRPRDLE